MRTFFFFALLLCVAGHAVAQNIVDSFWNVKFGTDMETTKSIIQKTKNLSPVNTSNDMLFYNPGTFGGYKCDDVLLLFEDNQFALATVIYPSTPAKVFSDYNNIRLAIIKKYGNPYKITEDYTPPYRKGDGDEVRAIQLKHAQVKTKWTNDPTSFCMIEVEINTDLSVVLTYFNRESAPSKDTKNEF